MCKYLSYICCCFKKPKKPLDPHIKTADIPKYGTDWETNVENTNMTPSDIQDSLVTKNINISHEKYPNRIEWYKAILQFCGYKFEFEEPIGKGAYGEVYKIKEIKTQTNRALKVLKMKTGEDLSKVRFEMFKYEIFSLRKNRHKNIIELIDHFMVEELLCFIVMEFAEGGDLKEKLNYVKILTGKPFTENDTKYYFIQIANAMHFIHKNGLIHGDLKLENVLIVFDKKGKQILKVTDFGCARVAYKQDSGIRLKDRAGGTIVYMAPEQIRVYITMNLKKPEILNKAAKSYNPLRSDVWSLGVCLYRMLFFEYPFKYDSRKPAETLPLMLKHMKKGYEIPKDMAKKLSAECLDMLSGLMEYNKNNRIDMQIVMSHKWVIGSPDLDKI